jgi:hypothetical protein
MLVAPLLLLAVLAEGSFPDPAELIRNAIAASKAQDAKNEKFTWREDEVRTDDKGAPIKGFRRTYENIMLEGDNYRKLILVDGQPLDAKMAKKVEEDLAKTRQQRKGHRLFHTTVSLGGIELLGRLFDSKVTGEDLVDGRKTWRVESEPKRGIKPANPEEAESLATRRVTWFDQQEGVELRRLTTFIRATHRFQAGTETQMDWSKVGDAFLLSSLDFRWHLKFLPGVAPSGDSRYRYYDYKRFSTESTFIPN